MIATEPFYVSWYVGTMRPTAGVSPESPADRALRQPVAAAKAANTMEREPAAN
jgi:hypothetical protein